LPAGIGVFCPLQIELQRDDEVAHPSQQSPRWITVPPKKVIMNMKLRSPESLTVVDRLDSASQHCGVDSVDALPRLAAQGPLSSRLP
jgi:hypothetical protein